MNLRLTRKLPLALHVFHGEMKRRFRHRRPRQTSASAALGTSSIKCQLFLCLTGCRRFNEPEQGQDCLPYVRRQPIPCSDDPLQIGVKRCHGRTIKVPVLQRICSAALRTIDATTSAVSGYVRIEVGFDSHLGHCECLRMINGLVEQPGVLACLSRRRSWVQIPSRSLK